jgi:glycosyltransferase involved in cell wall biosynthesis
MHNSQGNIIFVLESWGYGGTETYTRQLIDYLLRNGYCVEIIFLKQPIPFENNLNIPVHVISIYSLLQFLRCKEVKLCHLHLYTSLLPVTVIVKLLGIYVLTTLHMPYLCWGFRHRLYTKLATSFANRVVGVSKDATKGLISSNIYSFAIPGPVDRTFTQVQRNNKDNATFTVIAVGRLSREKRLDVLIRAMQICSSKLGKNCRLVHFGEGPIYRELSTLAQELGVAVEWKGVQSSLVIADALAQADVFVLPSQFEGLPLSAVEAMSTGVAVILSDFASAKELVEDGVTGHTFPIGNSYALAELLLWHSSHPQLSAVLGKAGREFVLSQFSEDRCFGQYLTLYDELLHDN